MFEHVGLSQLHEYFGKMCTVLRPGGRLLNHSVGRPTEPKRRFANRGFIDAYVFPDKELHEVGTVVSAMQHAGFEVRHVESLREHYALTLRAWVANLESHWDEAVAEVGEPRARIWQLYMAGCALGFEDGAIEIHQALAVRPGDGGRSGMPRRPGWDGKPLLA